MINIASVNQNLAALTLKNWTNPLGTSMIEVAQLAVTHTGVKVLFLLAHWRVGALDKVEMQFLRRASRHFVRVDQVGQTPAHGIGRMRSGGFQEALVSKIFRNLMGHSVQRILLPPLWIPKMMGDKFE